MYELKDDYEVFGKNEESLLEEIREMESRTTYVTVDAKDIEIQSYVGKMDDFFVFNNIRHDNIGGGEKRVTTSEAAYEDLLTESVSSAGVVITAPIEGRTRAIYVSPHGITAMAEKSGVGGPRINDPSYYRDLYIAEGLFKKDKVKLVLRSEDREDGKAYKLFGVLSEKYKNISLEVIPEVIDSLENTAEMGSPEFRMWRNSQSYTEAVVEFPDAADELQAIYSLPVRMIPGVRISTSDIGEASIRVQGTYRSDKNRTFTVNSEVKRNHMGKIELSDIVEDVKKEIYSQFKYIPEKLSSLMGKAIGSEDLTTEKGQIKNKELVEKAIRKGIRSLHISKAIGQKRAKDLENSLSAEVSGSVQYTEFDIALMFLTVGDRIAELPDNARKMLEKAVANAPFVRYQNSSADEEIILLPEEV